jgi:hypothetical protein
MARKSTQARALNTLQVSPLTLARETVGTALLQVRQTMALAQQLAASIRSVELVSDDVRISYQPAVIDSRGLLRVPVGDQDIGLRADLSLARQGNSMLLGLRLDAHLLERLDQIERLAGNPLGTLIAQASCHLHTKVRVVLAETIEAEPLPTQTAPRRRLNRNCAQATDCAHRTTFGC